MRGRGGALGGDASVAANANAPFDVNHVKGCLGAAPVGVFTIGQIDDIHIVAAPVGELLTGELGDELGVDAFTFADLFDDAVLLGDFAQPGADVASAVQPVGGSVPFSGSGGGGSGGGGFGGGGFGGGGFGGGGSGGGGSGGGGYGGGGSGNGGPGEGSPATQSVSNKTGEPDPPAVVPIPPAIALLASALACLAALGRVTAARPRAPVA
jgi:hypothetical protein